VRGWADVEAEVIDGFFRFSPGQARVVGDHRFDGVVGDRSASTIRARIQEIERQLDHLASLTDLSQPQDIDRRALVAQLQASRFELAELRTPFRDPVFYAGFGSELDVSGYLKRPYAPIGDRRDALRRHLGGYAGYLEAARDNLEPSLARPNLDVAIDAVEGQVEYLEGEVFQSSHDDAVTRQAVERAAVETRSFASFLRQRLAGAHEHDALGEPRFRELLRCREMVTMDVPSLERMVRSDVARNTLAAQAAAEQLVPGGSIGEALTLLQAHHPTIGSIIGDVAGMLDGLKAFILEHDLMSIPAGGVCIVRPTPAYASFISAAMDSAGPLETVATESYYYVTVPSADWDSARSEEWLRYLNYAVLEDTSIHEAYPGHFVQALHERRAASPSRQLFWVQSTGEGYAHYCEQMMLEAGYSTDPRLHLAQRLDALLRDCRFLTSLGLHCRGMTMSEAVDLFQSVGFLTELPARREATRGAWDPLYLNYTLGKLLILELREVLARRPAYSLKRFHDAFLGCGNLPVPLITELLG
jgi:uncharacterized protein DUF885